MTGNHHLGNALTVVDDEVLLRQVNQHYANLTTIVGINGSGCIQHGQSVLQGQSAAGTHLGFVALGQCDVQTSRNQTTLHRMQRDRRIEVRTQIHSCTLWRSVCGQLLVPTVDDLNLNHFRNVSY